MLRRAAYNEKVDMYSLGVILLEMCVRFDTLSERFFTIQVYFGALCERRRAGRRPSDVAFLHSGAAEAKHRAAQAALRCQD